MSTEKYFETGESPHVIVEQIRGNLQLRAWGELRVMVSGNGDDYHFAQEGNEVHLSGFEDCRIFVPAGATLTLGQVEGNANLSGVRGEISIEQVHGNLHGSEVGTTRIGNVHGDFTMRSVAGPLEVGRVHGNCTVSEVEGNVQVEVADGNCTVREVAGHVAVERVRGNFNSSDTNTLHVEKVSGNMNVKSLKGNVQAAKVGGNLTAVDIMGDLSVEGVGGDLKVRELLGGLNASVGGNAKLDLQELSIPFATVNAGGDVRCRVPLTVDAQVSLRAGSGIIIKNLEMPNQMNSHSAEFTLGAGEGRLEFRAGNRVKLIGGEGEAGSADWEVEADFQYQGEFSERAAELVQQVAEQVEAQVESITRQLNERLAQLDTGDAIAAKVQMKVQSAMRQAEEKIAEAMRRAERQAERQAERSAARDARVRVRMVPPAPPMPPMPPIPPMPGMGGRTPMAQAAQSPLNAAKSKRNAPSAEERMLVLKMLEEGKITVEQAEQLLAAMGGD